MPVYQSFTMVSDSWWSNVVSPHTFTTTAAYLIPLLAYKQRAGGPGRPISSYAYLAPLAMTLAQTMATCGQRGWQNALTTTLQWQLPAWALAYYLSHYKEPYDQENNTEKAKQDFNELYGQYQQKLPEFLQEIDEFIVKNDGIIAPRGLGDELKKDYKGLVALYTQIMNYPEPGKPILSPAQELYARYIAYKVAKRYKLSLSTDPHGLSNAIINNAEDMDAIKYLNEQGFAVGDLRKFVDNIKDHDTFNKISAAVVYFNKRIDQQEVQLLRDQQSSLVRNYHHLLDEIFDNLDNPSIDLENLYIRLKDIYNQLQKWKISDKVMPPYDAIYTVVVARSIKPSILTKRDLDSNSEQDRLQVLKLAQEFSADIARIIHRSQTLTLDILQNKGDILDASNEVAYQEISKTLIPIMQIVNELRKQ